MNRKSSYVGLISIILIFSIYTIKIKAENNCEQCQKDIQTKDKKRNELIRIQTLIQKNQEYIKNHNETSVIIKINSNILLASLTREALETEIEHLQMQISKCGECNDLKIRK